MRWSQRCAAVVSVAVLCCACAGVPFEPVERVPLHGVDPAAARARFASVTPRSCELLTSVVFEYWGHEISALGAVAVDSATGEFALTCMTPVGVKIFEISGTPGSEICEFAIEGFEERFTDEERGAAAVADDVRAMYLELVPEPSARVHQTDTALHYRTGDEENGIEWVLAGLDVLLVEKRVTVDGDLRSRVRYFEYAMHGGRAIPGGIVLDNERFGYRLIVRTKDVLD